MADSQTLAVVHKAIALAQSHPHAPALDILDLAMAGRHGMDADFDAPGEAFGDWTDPPSPFGELLRRAFAPDTIDAGAAALWVSEDMAVAEAQGALIDQWQEDVIEPFARRYRLWPI